MERKFRKGDRLKTIGDRDMPYESTLEYIVVKDEDAVSGKVRIQLDMQPDVPGRMKWSTEPVLVHASQIRRWILLEEGPAPKPNNRVTRIKAVDIRLGETVRFGNLTMLVTMKKGLAGVWTVFGEDGRVITVDGTDDVEVLGARGRKAPGIVHYNPYAASGVVTVQWNARPGFGAHACGVVSLFDVYASTPALVTCGQACAHEVAEDVRRGRNTK